MMEWINSKQLRKKLKRCKARLKAGIDLIGAVYQLPVPSEITEILMIRFWQLRCEWNIHTAKKLFGMRGDQARYYGLKVTVKDIAEAGITDCIRYYLFYNTKWHAENKPSWGLRIFKRLPCYMGSCLRYTKAVMDHPLFQYELGGLPSSEEDMFTYALLLMMAGERCVEANTELRWGDARIVEALFHMDQQLRAPFPELVAHHPLMVSWAIRDISKYLKKAASFSREDGQKIPIRCEKAFLALFASLADEAEKWKKIKQRQRDEQSRAVSA